ncbi:MAG: trehalose-phosphatase [Thermoleophilia bacterium]
MPTPAADRTSPAARAAQLAPLRERPSESAIVLDVDGTLAPIVPRPELAAVPPATRVALARLVERYLLVACVSGRPGAEAEALVGVPGIRAIGNHGLELDPRAADLARGIAAFREEIEPRWPIEDKRLSLSLHYRDVADETVALAGLTEIAELAREQGLEARWGRKVLEIRPAHATDKGVAVSALVQASGARLGLFAGDDATDVDAFRGLAALPLDHAVAVGVLSPEAPRSLYTTATLLVEGTEGLRALLDELGAC